MSKLLKGSIIGWIKAGTPRSNPFTIKTRLATASIQGTTVFIELTDQKFKIFSWEGTVQVETENGQYFTLRSGQQLLLDLKRQMAEVSHQLDGLESALGTIGGVTTQPFSLSRSLSQCAASSTR
jgi:ferric-dicitrate binding protein FerR (iron transport regulator)